MESDAELVLGKMRLLKEHFRFNDNSSAEDIKDYFGISKKHLKELLVVFKKWFDWKSGDYFTLKNRRLYAKEKYFNIFYNFY